MNKQVYEDKFTFVNGYKTRYWKLGDSDKVIVLIHGLGSMIESWHANIEYLSKDHTVYALDLLGFGLSGKPRLEYSIPLLTEFLKSFFESVQIEKAILIGNSMGGSIALSFADKYPLATEKIVLIASAGLSKKVPLGLRLLTVPRIGEFLNKPSKAGISHMLKTVFYNKEFINDDFIYLSLNMAMQKGAGYAFLKTLRSMGNFMGAKDNFYKQTIDTFSKLKHPAMLFWGREDMVLPYKFAEKNIIDKGVETHVFNECGHLPHMEYADVFHEKIANFIN